MLRCRVGRDEKRDNREVPAWMFDEGRCAMMELCTDPHVCWESLVELKELLRVAVTARLPSSDDLSLQTRERPNESQTQAAGSTPTGGAVRGNSRPTEMDGASERGAP